MHVGTNSLLTGNLMESRKPNTTQVTQLLIRHTEIKIIISFFLFHDFSFQLQFSKISMKSSTLRNRTSSMINERAKSKQNIWTSNLSSLFTFRNTYDILPNLLPGFVRFTTRQISESSLHKLASQGDWFE